MRKIFTGLVPGCWARAVETEAAQRAKVARAKGSVAQRIRWFAYKYVGLQFMGQSVIHESVTRGPGLASFLGKTSRKPHPRHRGAAIAGPRGNPIEPLWKYKRRPHAIQCISQSQTSPMI